MHSNENIDTYLPKDGCWIVLHSDAGNYICSNAISDIANSLNMQLETLISLLKNTDDGKWPVLLGGRTFQLSSMEVTAESRILSLKPLKNTEIANLLYSITADEIFILLSSPGHILAMSPGAVSLFGEKSNLVSLFDSSSSGAILAAVQKCTRTGFTQDFLVCHTSDGSERVNYSMSMRQFPSPGKLIYCRLAIPSVAIVTRSTDKVKLISAVLEKSFCPASIIDGQGLVTYMNEIARDTCLNIWGVNPTGSSCFEFIHPDHRKIVKLRHEQIDNKNTTASRFTVRLLPSMTRSELSIYVSALPIPETDQWVIFFRAKSGLHDGAGSGVRIDADSEGERSHNHNKSIPSELLKLLSEEEMSQTEIVGITTSFLGAASAAFVHEGEVVTVGDSRGLMPLLDPIQLAARPGGFQEDGFFLHRIHSGFGISHLVLQGIHDNSLSPSKKAVLKAASIVLGEREARAALRAGHRILSTVKTLAEGYLKNTEPLEGLLSDLVKECRAETAVVFKINPKGSALKGIGSSGVVGMLPELPIEALNTASWACLRGETAFFAEMPEDDLRFSPVFPNSLSELAVPFFNGSTTDGVILLASTETEAFHYAETELIQLMAILFTAPESSSGDRSTEDNAHGSDALKQQILEYILHNITAFYSSSEIRLESLRKQSNGSEKTIQELKHLTDSVVKLSFFSRWTLWWLKISVYNGSPDQRWIDPVPLLEKVLGEFRKVSDPKGIKLNFSPPMNDIEVCTDGSFISMIAYSLLFCIMDYCTGCESVELVIDQKESFWSFRFDTAGGSVPGKCLSVNRLPERESMAFTLAWKLTEELGGTVSTFSNKGKTTRMIIRLKVSG